MARIRRGASELGVAAVMIDGYAPKPDEFEALPWGQIRRHYGLDYFEWISRIRAHQRSIKEKYKETTYLTAYRNAIEALRRAICPVKTKASWGTPTHDLPEPVSSYIGFSTGKTHGSLETPRRWAIITQEVRMAQLSTLQREYRYDEQKRRLHYLQNVIVYPVLPEKGCAEEEACCENWIETLHFSEKRKDDYVDYESFSRAWSLILDDMISFHPECPFYSHLYNHIGIDYRID